jgi:hypothetical protein
MRIQLITKQDISNDSVDCKNLGFIARNTIKNRLMVKKSNLKTNSCFANFT